MDQDQIAVMKECNSLSLAGKISFPQVVGKLREIGVERYHADFSRQEKTYYMPEGQTHIESLGKLPEPTAERFSAAGVESAIREIQRGEINYLDFLRKIMGAGCVGYFVQITGRCALYFGRNGEVHRELFPSAPKAN